MKADFIEKCGQYREENKQKAPETKGEGNTTVKSGDITIAFQKVSSEDKLEPKDKDLFDRYFLRKEDKDKTYKTSTSA